MNTPVHKKSVVILVLVAATAMALLSLFYFMLKKGDPSLLPSALINKLAPAFEVVALPAEAGAPPFPTFTADDLKNDHIKLVNFWASWCGPCREEHPVLVSIAASGVPIYGINRKDSAQNARTFLKTHGNPYTGIITDLTGRTGIDWGVYGMPETYVIGADGKILKRIVGPITIKHVLEIEQLSKRTIK